MTFIYQVISFCEDYKSKPKFIDNVIEKIMGHSSLDTITSPAKKAKLMGSVFVKLHLLINSKQNERTEKILSNIKEHLQDLGDMVSTFKTICTKKINNFETMFDETFKINKACIVDSDEDDSGNINGFIDNSSDSDSDSGSGSNDESDSTSDNNSHSDGSNVSKSNDTNDSSSTSSNSSNSSHDDNDNHSDDSHSNSSYDEDNFRNSEDDSDEPNFKRKRKN